MPKHSVRTAYHQVRKAGIDVEPNSCSITTNHHTLMIDLDDCEYIILPKFSWILSFSFSLRLKKAKIGSLLPKLRLVVMMLSAFAKVFPVALLSTLARAQLSGSVGPLTSYSTKASTKVCNVEDYGAENGHPSVDFGPAFSSAWADCKDGGLVWIPPGEWFMQTAVTLDDGSATAVQLDGTIYRYAAITADEMILIENGNDVEFFSGNSQGAIQGYGYQYISQGEYGTRLMRVQNTENFSVHGFALVDSPSYYLTLDTCTNGEIYNLIMRGIDVGETDAIDVWGSNMYIHDVEVTNGDECVTTKSPANNFLIEDVYCNISGGCSIGSLGLNTDISNVYYHRIYCNRADPAFLKTNGGSGTVKNMVWDTVIVYYGAYPLSIDSSWGDSDGGDGVQMTNFTFKVRPSVFLKPFL